MPLGFTFERKTRSDRAIGLRRNGGERRSCLPDLLVPAGFEPAVARLSTSLSLMAGSRRCRSPSACALHSGSGRGREPSRLTALEWRTTVVLITSPYRAPTRFQRVPARLSGRSSSKLVPRVRFELTTFASKRDTSTELGYRGGLVLAERFERPLDRLSTCFLCRLGYASWCGSWDSNPDWARFKRAASAD